MRSGSLVALSIVLFLTATAGVTYGAIAPTATKTLAVDCSKGKSINAALQDESVNLIVEIRGICAEAVMITRDNVTLRGVGGAAGIDGTGLPEPLPDGITVKGASNVSLTGLSVRNMRNGIAVIDGAAASLEQMVLEDNIGSGINVTRNATLQVKDVSSRANAYYGISLWANCSLQSSGTLVTSANGWAGILIDSSDFSAWDATIEANDQPWGIAFQQGSSGMLGRATVATRRNEVGVEVGYGSQVLMPMLQSQENENGVWIHTYSRLDTRGTISQNTGDGIWCEWTGTADLINATVSDNGGAGVRLDDSSHAHVFGSRIEGNGGGGVIVDDSDFRLHGSVVSGNTGSDVGLWFGTHALFGTGNTVGIVECDGTVLVRGGVSCPAASSLGKPSGERTFRERPRIHLDPLNP